jgi:hypothetical protein
MRTTIALDDDLIPQLKNYARHRDLSVAKAVSELVRKGLAAPLRTREVHGFHVVVLPPDSPEVTRGHVRELENQIE